MTLIPQSNYVFHQHWICIGVVVFCLFVFNCGNSPFISLSSSLSELHLLQLHILTPIVSNYYLFYKALNNSILFWFTAGLFYYISPFCINHLNILIQCVNVQLSSSFTVLPPGRGALFGTQSYLSPVAVRGFQVSGLAIGSDTQEKLFPQAWLLCISVFCTHELLLGKKFFCFIVFSASLICMRWA